MIDSVHFSWAFYVIAIQLEICGKSHVIRSFSQRVRQKLHCWGCDSGGSADKYQNPQECYERLFLNISVKQKKMKISNYQIAYFHYTVAQEYLPSANYQMFPHRSRIPLKLRISSSLSGDRHYSHLLSPAPHDLRVSRS